MSICQCLSDVLNNFIIKELTDDFTKESILITEGDIPFFLWNAFKIYENIKPSLLKTFYVVLRNINKNIYVLRKKFEMNKDNEEEKKLIAIDLVEMYDRRYIVNNKLNEDNKKEMIPFDNCLLGLKSCVFLADNNDPRKNKVLDILKCLYDLIFFENENLHGIDIDDVYELSEEGLVSLTGTYSLNISTKEINSI